MQYKDSGAGLKQGVRACVCLWWNLQQKGWIGFPSANNSTFLDIKGVIDPKKTIYASHNGAQLQNNPLNPFWSI